MKILLTGGTGFIGRVLGKSLTKRGHQLVVLTRKKEETLMSLSYPAQVVSWDASKALPPIQSLKGIEAVVHLAGAPIAGQRWTAKQKQRIRDSRILGTRHLIQGLTKADAPLRTFVSGSAVGFYGDRGDETLHEGSHGGEGFLAEVCKDWEREAEALLKGFPQVSLSKIRTGLVLGDDGGFLKELLPLFQMGLGGRLARGNQWMSWIHIRDLVSLIVFCLDHPQVSGVFNGVAPAPITNDTFTKVLGEVLNVATPFPAPKPALRLALGEMSDLLLMSQRVLPKRALREGFKFHFVNLKEALEDVVCPLPAGAKRFVAEQWVPYKPEEIFSFFEDEQNLEEITPPWLNFEVLGKSTERIQRGTKINYRLRFRGISMGWQSQIKDWKENECFIDSQTKGPYKKWHHTHRFEPLGRGTLLRDEVIYELPAGVLGRLMAGRIVDGDVSKIFRHRQKVIYERFGVKKPGE